MKYTMNPQDTEFERIIHEHKSTIYTVCYMFSKDADEVNDLFQEVLINLWKGYASFKGREQIRNMDMACQFQYLLFGET